MTLTTATIGFWHRISGTISEVITELNTAGIKPDQIAWYSDGGTNAACLYRKG